MKGCAMGQVLHASATTTQAVRRAIQHSQESLRANVPVIVNNTKCHRAIPRLTDFSIRISCMRTHIQPPAPDVSWKHPIKPRYPQRFDEPGATGISASHCGLLSFQRAAQLNQTTIYVNAGALRRLISSVGTLGRFVTVVSGTPSVPSH